MSVSKNLLFCLICFLPVVGISQATRDTINELKTNRSKPAFYKAPNGKIYPVQFVSDPSEAISIQSAICSEDIFSGTNHALRSDSLPRAFCFFTWNSQP